MSMARKASASSIFANSSSDEETGLSGGVPLSPKGIAEQIELQKHAGTPGTAKHGERRIGGSFLAPGLNDTATKSQSTSKAGGPKKKKTRSRRSRVRRSKAKHDKSELPDTMASNPDFVGGDLGPQLATTTGTGTGPIHPGARGRGRGGQHSQDQNHGQSTFNRAPHYGNYSRPNQPVNLSQPGSQFGPYGQNVAAGQSLQSNLSQPTPMNSPFITHAIGNMQLGLQQQQQQQQQQFTAPAPIQPTVYQNPYTMASTSNFGPYMSPPMMAPPMMGPPMVSPPMVVPHMVAPPVVAAPMAPPTTSMVPYQNHSFGPPMNTQGAVGQDIVPFVPAQPSWDGSMLRPKDIPIYDVDGTVLKVMKRQRIWVLERDRDVAESPSPELQMLKSFNPPYLSQVLSHLPFAKNSSLFVPPCQTGVVHISNIKYAASREEVLAIFGRSSRANNDRFEPVHIILDRVNGKTMDAFVEFITHQDAADAIAKLNNSKRYHKIGDRNIGVNLSNHSELQAALFPRAKGICWNDVTPERIAIRDDEPFNRFKCIMTSEEISGMERWCLTPERCPFTQNCPQRPYEFWISTLRRFPWHMPEFYTVHEQWTIYRATEIIIRHLAELVKYEEPAAPRAVNNSQAQNLDSLGKIDKGLLQRLVLAAITCAGFTVLQKDNLVAMLLDFNVEVDYYAPYNADSYWFLRGVSPKPDAPLDVVDWYVQQIKEITKQWNSTLDVGLQEKNKQYIANCMPRQEKDRFDCFGYLFAYLGYPFPEPDKQTYWSMTMADLAEREFQAITMFLEAAFPNQSTGAHMTELATIRHPDKKEVSRDNTPTQTALSATPDPQFTMLPPAPASLPKRPARGSTPPSKMARNFLPHPVITDPLPSIWGSSIKSNSLGQLPPVRSGQDSDVAKSSSLYEIPKVAVDTTSTSDVSNSSSCYQMPTSSTSNKATKGSLPKSSSLYQLPNLSMGKTAQGGLHKSGALYQLPKISTDVTTTLGEVSTIPTSTTEYSSGSKYKKIPASNSMPSSMPSLCQNGLLEVLRNTAHATKSNSSPEHEFAPSNSRPQFHSTKKATVQNVNDNEQERDGGVCLSNFSTHSSNIPRSQDRQPFVHAQTVSTRGKDLADAGTSSSTGFRAAVSMPLTTGRLDAPAITADTEFRAPVSGGKSTKLSASNWRAGAPRGGPGASARK